MGHIDPHSAPYERRQIVAKMGKAGTFRVGRRVFTLWKYMTFFTGNGKPGFAAEFVRKADIDKNGFLRLETVREGEIVVAPGLVYKKIPMTGNIMTVHLQAMKTFRPRDTLNFEKDKGPAVDLGEINLTKKETIQ